MEPSFEAKKIIWDVAATMGLKNFSAIEREVDFQLKKLRQGKNFFEETPDQRKIKDIILNDIQKLSPETVIAKLPRHVWTLRKDHQYLLDLANGKIIPRVVLPNVVEKRENDDQPAARAVPDESKPKLSDVEFANEVLKIAKNKPGYIYYSDFYHLNPNPNTTFYLFSIRTILKSNGYVCHPSNERGTWGCNYHGSKTHFHHPTLGSAEEKIISGVVLPDVGEKQLARDQPPTPIVPRIKTNSSDSDDEFTNKVLQIARNKKGLIFYGDFYHLNPKPGTSYFLFKVKNILISNGYTCHERKDRPNWGCAYDGPNAHFHPPGV